MSIVRYMGHFCNVKTKETDKLIYPWILPSKKKHSIWFIYFCIESINIVLCKSRSIYMFSVAYVGYINLKLNKKHI